MLRCLEPQDTERVLRGFHDGPTSGHYAGDTTTHKLMRVGYYWPTLSKESYAYARKCPACQICVDRDQNLVAPHLRVVIEKPFQQWRLDVIG